MGRRPARCYRQLEDKPCPKSRGFTKIGVNDYLELKSEGRMADGANAKLLGCHGPLASCQPGQGFIATTMENCTVEVPFCIEFFMKTFASRLIEVWPTVEAALKNYGLSGTLNVAECYISVASTYQLRDPDMMDRVTGCIALLAKTNAPLYMALNVLDGKVLHVYIKTGIQEDGLCKIHGIDVDQYVRQLEQLSVHSKTIEFMMGCIMFLNDHCVIAVGNSVVHLKAVRETVKRCIVNNICLASLVKRMYALGVSQRLETLHF